jgi:hypothetical protein
MRRILRIYLFSGMHQKREAKGEPWLETSPGKEALRGENRINHWEEGAREERERTARLGCPSV